MVSLYSVDPVQACSFNGCGLSRTAINGKTKYVLLFLLLTFLFILGRKLTRISGGSCMIKTLGDITTIMLLARRLSGTDRVIVILYH